MARRLNACPGSVAVGYRAQQPPLLSTTSVPYLENVTPDRPCQVSAVRRTLDSNRDLPVALEALGGESPACDPAQEHRRTAGAAPLDHEFPIGSDVASW